MANKRKVRFTGKRTGLEQIAVPRIGLVTVGSVIEVDADQAERWLELVDADGNSDWAASGEASSDEASAAEMQKQREKAAAEAAEATTREAPSEKK